LAQVFSSFLLSCFATFFLYFHCTHKHYKDYN